MSEHDILELLEAYTDAQMALITQIVSLHFALVVAVFYFLHRSGLVMRIAIFLLYTLGYSLYIGLVYSLSLKVLAGRQDLIAMRDGGADMSSITDVIMGDTMGPYGNVVSIIGNVALSALWFGAIYFLFFWKRPTDHA